MSDTVFDTVSSVGLPHLEPGGWLGYDFVITNTDLSPKVLNGFHALSADENRADFFPTYWTPRINITQVIFPGAHSDVGGVYAETGLSDRALAWMLPNLASQGLRFDLGSIRALQPKATDFGHDDGGSPPWDALPKKPRVFSSGAYDGRPAFGVDASMAQRWGQAVTLLPAKTTANYQATGIFNPDAPLVS